MECWVPVPSVADVRESAGCTGALPSARYPSDHVALVAEFSAAPGKVGRATAAAGERRPTMPLPASRFNVGKAAAAVRAGGVLALPTDTIYGVAAAADSSAGVRRLYALKGRDQAVPLALCVADAADVGRYGEAAHLPEGLLAALLPGPFTVILRQRADAGVAPEVNAAMAVKTVGLRVPDCAFIRAVCRAAGRALALTSANRSGAPSTVDVWEFRGLWDECDHVFQRVDGPLERGRAGSTILDLSEPGAFRVVRPGSALAPALAAMAEFGLARREP